MNPLLINKCSLMFWAITDCGFFLFSMVLDFCICCYWEFYWWKGGWEKLLWLLFPHANRAFIWLPISLKHVSRGKHYCYIFFYASENSIVIFFKRNLTNWLKQVLFCVSLLFVWSLRTLGDRSLISLQFLKYSAIG